jgi:hypothetical protein
MFVMGGVGGASVTRHDATDQEREDATQPLGMLGFGIERRFHHLALQAEARVVGLAEPADDDVTVVDRMEPAGGSAVQARGGGSLTLGLSYYF